MKKADPKMLYKLPPGVECLDVKLPERRRPDCPVDCSTPGGFGENHIAMRSGLDFTNQFF